MENETSRTSQTSIPKKTPRKEPFLSEVIRFILISLAIVIPLRMYIAEPFIVSGSSMSPTFETGDYLIIDQVTYRFENPERGDIVVFHYPKNPDKFFIKRLIGLPGETLQIKNGQVIIINEDYPDGLLLDEPYVKLPRNESIVQSLAPDEYFVLGDNRAASSDSRIWGTLNRDLIVGQVLLRLFPVSDIGILPGEYNQ